MCTEGKHASAMMSDVPHLQEDEAGNILELIPHTNKDKEKEKEKEREKDGNKKNVWCITIAAGSTLAASLYLKPSKAQLWDFILPLHLRGIPTANPVLSGAIKLHGMRCC